MPGLRERIPEEFVAEENIHLRHKHYPDAAKVREDDDTVCTSNRSTDLPAPYVPSKLAERRGPLTFDPTPPAEDDDDPSLAAADDLAELMRWHYRLGHVSFATLK